VDITGSSAVVSYDSIVLRHDAPVRRVYLLFHGLTATPLQFEAFGRLLFDRGADVFIPRLPRHGYADRMTPALADLSADELRDFAGASFARARAFAGEVVVAGFSVGGLLAAYVGQHFPVHRATAIAPFMGILGLPPSLTAATAGLLLAAPNRFLWWDPHLRENLLPAHGYPRFATHALAQAARLGQELLRSARSQRPAAAGVDIVLNARESAVSNAAARTLARSWALTTRQRIVLHHVKGLPPSHDIIEPLRHPAIVRRVYPPLVDLVAR
jgi:alpha-beta hydrolase superfamily lysophospholipase